MGMYGGAGGRGGGGMEMMMIVICCICCLCLVSIFAGYWFDMFCGVSPSLGRNCKKKDEEEDNDNSQPNTGDPIVPPPAVETCNSTRAKVVRAARDPRPELLAHACNGATKVTGRDCFYWRVEPDPVTRMARWVRETDSDLTDFRDGSCVKEQVRCTNRIDFSKMQEYTDLNPGMLLAQCTPVNPSADTRETTVEEITKAATRVGVSTGNSVWNNQDSMIWYDRVANKVLQRSVFTLINNTETAAKNVRNSMGRTRMSKVVFATMLEAAMSSTTSNIDYIGDLSRAYVSAQGAKSEATFLQFLDISVRNLTKWQTIIDNASMYRR
jgi:hypothetical protein